MEQRYNDFSIEINQNANYPLIKLMKKSYEMKIKAEKEKEMQEQCRLLQIQNQGLNTVKDHILKRKREFLCHQKERVHEKQMKKKALEKSVLCKYNLNLANINTRNKIREKLVSFDKNEKMKINTQKQRMKNIVQKLLTEMEFKEKEKEESSPKQKTIKRKEPEEDVEIADVIIINASAISNLSKKTGKPELNEEDAVLNNETDVEEWADVVIPKKVKSRKTILLKKEKSKKSLKKEESKQIGKKHGFVMPYIPIINPRLKIKPTDEQKMIDLIPPCEAMNIYLDELKEFMAEMKSCPIDQQFSSKPNVVFFEDFENNNRYTRKLRIFNYSAETAVCSFERIISDDEFCNVCFEVEDVGIQKIFAGKNYCLKIKFRPKDIKAFEGKLVFLTRRIHDSEIKRFEVPIKCQIATIKLSIQPEHVIFKSVPIWKVKNHPQTNEYRRTIEVRNDMIHECCMIIRKKRIKAECYENEGTIAQRKNKKQQKKQIKKSRKFSKNEVVEHVTDILDHCLEYVGHMFYFNTYFIQIPAKSSVNIDAFYKELPYIGTFTENFEFEFISRTKKELVTKSILTEIDVTGKFIVPETEYIDYQICVFNSVYQDSVVIHNQGTSRLKIGFLLPAKVKSCFTIYPATFFMKPLSSESVSIRFMPRLELLHGKSKYYDFYTGILSFPVKICILAPRDLGVPPSAVTVFAILTQTDLLNVRFVDRTVTYLSNDVIPILHLGTVTTHETVIADIEIENLSAVVQDFAFLNLPEAISIGPNYGFGKLNPNETKTLKLYFSPTIYDMITTEKMHTSDPVDVSYKLTCTTENALGEIKEKTVPGVTQSLRKGLPIPIVTGHTMPSFYEMETDDDLFEYHEFLFEQEELEQMYSATNNVYDTDVDMFEGDNPDTSVQEDDIIQIMKNLSIIVKATIVDYWTEISHQNVIFPDTPMGSFSTMKFHISATNHTSVFSDCVCGFIKKSKLPNFDCHFEIYGGTDGITIEPICGDLKKNEHKQIYLIARPETEEKKLKGPGLSFQKLKNKESSKNFDVDSLSTIKSITKLESETYLAEKEMWKVIKPHIITANYTIIINFKEIEKSDEIIYLTVTCKVIKPEFITSLRSQHINFGLVPILSRPKIIFQIQNVSRHTIEPEIELISPVGPFICATQHKLQLEKEFILAIPVTFAPTSEIVYNEFFEIKTRSTIETLMVSGEGILAAYEITPEFNVYRLKSSGSKSEDCVFNFENNCKASIVLNIIKVCELQGIIEDEQNKKKEEVTESPDPLQAAKLEPSKVKSGKKPKEKEKKNTIDLTNAEEYSLGKHFKIHTGHSPFRVVDANDNKIIVLPFSKQVIKIRFETPKILKVKDDTANSKHKKNKKSKKQEVLVSVNLDKFYKYVAKYNIMVGEVELIKELILIGQFH